MFLWVVYKLVRLCPRLLRSVRFALVEVSKGTVIPGEAPSAAAGAAELAPAAEKPAAEEAAAAQPPPVEPSATSNR